MGIDETLQVASGSGENGVKKHREHGTKKLLDTYTAKTLPAGMAVFLILTLATINVYKHL